MNGFGGTHDPRKTTMDRFQEVHQRAPRSGEMIDHSDSVWIFRPSDHVHRWEFLCDPVMSEDEHGFEYEISPGIVIQGTLAQLMDVVMRARGMVASHAAEVVKVIFQFLKEGGWRGPQEQVPEDVREPPQPGSVCGVDDEAIITVSNIHDVLSQLRDPGFNGWLELEHEGGRVTYHNIIEHKKVEVVPEVPPKTCEHCGDAWCSSMMPSPADWAPCPKDPRMEAEDDATITAFITSPDGKLPKNLDSEPTST